MKTKSCKAKARQLQNELRDQLRMLAHTLNLGLQDDDIVGREMGQPGCDIRMSPAAIEKLGRLEFECKNKQTINVMQEFEDHCLKYTMSGGMKFLVHSKSAARGKPRKPRLVTMDLDTFVYLLGDHILVNKMLNTPEAQAETSARLKEVLNLAAKECTEDEKRAAKQRI